MNGSGATGSALPSAEPKPGQNATEAHHAVPRCLIPLHERANGLPLDGGGIQACLEWEWEAMRWRVPVEISREELEALVERSAVVLEKEKHRLVHGEDWRRWGSRGGRETLRRYGPRWFALLARRRWGPDRPGGARGGEDAQMRRAAQSEAWATNIASKALRSVFNARRCR